MILGYKFSREEIVNMIKEKCEKTKDDIYWTPNISVFLLQRGLSEDKKYYYPREDFYTKVYYTQLDFDFFLATKPINNYIHSMMQKIDESFNNNNYDTFGLKLKHKVKPYDFNVEELLNNYIYIKYNLFINN